MPKYGNSATGLQVSLPTSPQPPAVMQENILSKKLSLGLNFSTPSGEVTSPSLTGSMVWAYHTPMRFNGSKSKHYITNMLLIKVRPL